MSEQRLRKAIYTSNLLDKAREIIADPSVWTKTGLFLDPSSADSDTLVAPQVCAIGGICKAAKLAVCATEEALNYPEIQEALERLSSCSPVFKGDKSILYPIFTFNDNMASHEDILAIFDLAREEQCKIVRAEAAKVADADK